MTKRQFRDFWLLLIGWGAVVWFLETVFHGAKP